MRFRPALFLALAWATTAFGQTQSTSLPPVSQLVPRGTTFNPRITNVIGIEDIVATGAYVITYKLNEYRLNEQTEEAVKAIAGDVRKILIEGGFPGVLAEARYVRTKPKIDLLPLAPPSSTPNMSVQLLGNKLSVIGAGERPVEVLALSLKFESTLHDSPGAEQEYVPEAKRDFWFKLEEGKKLVAHEIDQNGLYVAARDIITNDALRAQMEAAAYRFALTNMLAAAERNAKTQEARERAAHILTERNAALAELQAIDNRLNEELVKAKSAN